MGGTSRSGPGSDPDETEIVRMELPKLFGELHISSMLDIPCGDFNWMNDLDIKFLKYIGADIVNDLVIQNKKKYSNMNRTFVKLDILKDTLPTVDLILCRDLLVHFSNKDAIHALNNIKKSGSKFLLATSFISKKENPDIVTGNWRPLNLLVAPFSLPKPIKIIKESHKTIKEYEDRSLLLWKIRDLQVF